MPMTMDEENPLQTVLSEFQNAEDKKPANFQRVKEKSLFYEFNFIRLLNTNISSQKAMRLFRMWGTICSLEFYT